MTNQVTQTARRSVALSLAVAAVLTGAAGCNSSAGLPAQNGSPCSIAADCVSNSCRGGTCADPASCAAVLAADSTAKDGSYKIDPDGPGGAASITVWCDMTTNGGGWTALPLAFADASLWSITQTGGGCASVPKVDKAGSLLTFQATTAMGWAYTSIKFVPPIPVTEVFLANLTHATATACNNMDLLYTVTPASTGDTTAESWYFADEDPMTPLAYALAAGCDSPGYAAAGTTPPECQMMQSDTPVQISRRIKLPSKASHFNMVAVEGCQSIICDVPTAQAERFYINHPSKAGGLWKDGILVR